MMAKNPDARFATPAEVAAALESHTAGCDLAALMMRFEAANPAAASSGEGESAAIDKENGTPPNTSAAGRAEAGSPAKPHTPLDDLPRGKGLATRPSATHREWRLPPHWAYLRWQLQSVSAGALAAR